MILVMACGGGDTGGTAAVGARDSLSIADTPATVADSGFAAGPQYPEPVRGRLVARGTDDEPLGGSWRARAGWCDRPRSLQIANLGDSVDVFLLLFPPDSGEPARMYPVVQRDSAPQGVEAPHARVGVQRLGYQVSSYQGTGGTVNLERLNRTASGRFDVLLQEALTWDTVRYLGVFANLPVASPTPEVCGAATDTGLVAPR